jgi:hypothetical protein
MEVKHILSENGNKYRSKISAIYCYMWKLIFEKCREFNLTFEPIDRNVFKKNNYNLIQPPPAEYLPR